MSLYVFLRRLLKPLVCCLWPTKIVNKENFLMDLISEATKLKIQIVDMHNKEIDDGMICNLVIKVKDKDELEHFKNSLNKYRSVEVRDN